MKTIRKGIVLLYKIFFLGLLGQFFLQTFVTYGLGLDYSWMQYIWLWKEVIIVILGILTVGVILWKQKWKPHFTNKKFNQYALLLIVTVVLCGITHFYFADGGLGAFAMAFKYDFLGFVIFLIALHSGLLLEQNQRRELIDWYGKVIKYALLLALIWYFIIFVKPGTLKLFGYNNWVFEGTVGSAPPAAYYTHINQGIPRNQFLFERPITWGFFLTALWPLFYILFLYKKPASKTWLWWVIYGVNIILTFSRAARGVWLIEIIMIPVILSIKNWKKILLKVGVPALLIFGVISVLGFEQIIDRGYSNTGHLAMIQQGWEMFVQSPLRGLGGATAGPGSHRGGIAFNPENQFLQIFIEFGIIGALPWMLMFIGLCLIGVVNYYKKKVTKTTIRMPDILLFAMSMGLIALAISGMVLHSFSDRMVVYPFMALFGLVWAYHRHSTCIGSNSDYNTSK